MQRQSTRSGLSSTLLTRYWAVWLRRSQRFSAERTSLATPLMLTAVTMRKDRHNLQLQIIFICKFNFPLSLVFVRDKGIILCKKIFLIFFEKGIDKRFVFCYNTIRSGRWCGSMAEQLICNQQVVGSTPITSSIFLGDFPSGQRGQTVNLLSFDFGGPNPPSPTRKKHLQMQVLFSVKSADGGRNPPAVGEIASR